jgi:hypothetical protein
MKRVSAALAVGILVSLGLTGCNGGDGSAYCNRVRDNAKNDTLNSIDPTSEKGMQTFLAEAKKLQADAPTEVEKDYDAIVQAFEDPTKLDAESVSKSIDDIQNYDEDHCDVTYKNN